MSQDTLSEAKLHELAYSCYNNRQYAKAADFFRFLAMQNAVSFDYWFGLGSSLLMQNKKKEAIAPFKQALFLQKEHPACTLFLAECLLFTSKISEAKELLTKARILCQNEQNETLSKHLTFLEKELLCKEPK